MIFKATFISLEASFRYFLKVLSEIFLKQEHLLVSPADKSQGWKVKMREEVPVTIIP